MYIKIESIEFNLWVNTMSQEKLHHCQLYAPSDPELRKDQLECLDELFKFNQIPPSRQKERQAWMKKMFADVGKNCYIESPFYSNWGGRHVHFGNNVYANFNLTLVDDTHIYVGDFVMFGPGVIVATASHPILPGLRRQKIEFNLPVHIEANAWIGAGAILLPDVTIGENSVIGAGSVVTKDIPANVIAVGNPCKVLRKISSKDREFYTQNFRIPDYFLKETSN